MKRIFQYFKLLQFGFIIISCTKNPVDPVDQADSAEKYHTVSGVVKEQGYPPDFIPISKAGVPVVLDDNTDITDSKGEYSFNKVTEGNHIISISLPDYEQYLDTITVLSSTIANIYLSKSDSIKYYTVSGIVLDVVYPNVSPFYKAGVPVILDNRTAISDSNGEYIFNGVTEGNHIISVSLPNYEYYLDTITVWSNTTKNIYLYGVKADYFPTIQVNTQKRFNYQASAGFAGIYDSGEALWSFDSLKEESGNQTYSVKETLIYTRTSGWGSPQVDTIITLFKIIEDNSHIITIELYPWSGINFNRYLDPRRGIGDIIKISSLDYTTSISLKKNVGLFKMQMSEPLHLSSIKYELIE